MSEIALRFSGVAKNYGRTGVLHDVSFEVARGDFFGLVGVNGAGKTTLLKCLLDFCDTDRGSIDIFDTPHRLTAARRRLAFLPERFNPPYYLSGEDFIKYVLEMQATGYDRGAAERMLHALDLDLAALSLPVRAYSKGMTQKLGLAACFLSGKDLYVLDEPTSGLDPKARALLKSHLRELKQRSRTVFFTSHALADVAEVCDRMAVMHAGRLCFAGTPAELCRQFATADLEQAFMRCIEAAPSPA
ncbi:MAG: ATP-binding cassette domain-containing protein [Pseudomonadota bacterium]